MIHCAAWTAVDLAETNGVEARRVNTDGTRNVANACRSIDCKMVYISTDYVFDGSGDRPWNADLDKCSPLNVYARTKLEGEQAVKSILEKFYIVRTSWVFGRNGKNFVNAILRLGKTQESVRVVCDQIGTPTYTKDLARLLGEMIQTQHYGCYHATNEGGYISWYDFARQILKMTGSNAAAIPVTTESYGLNIAQRPRNSRLDKEKLVSRGFTPLPSWQDALRRYLDEIGEAVNEQGEDYEMSH